MQGLRIDHLQQSLNRHWGRHWWWSKTCKELLVSGGEPIFQQMSKEGQTMNQNKCDSWGLNLSSYRYKCPGYRYCSLPSVVLAQLVWTISIMRGNNSTWSRSGDNVLPYQCIIKYIFTPQLSVMLLQCLYMISCEGSLQRYEPLINTKLCLRNNSRQKIKC